jgi:hypothetical protein
MLMVGVPNLGKSLVCLIQYLTVSSLEFSINKCLIENYLPLKMKKRILIRKRNVDVQLTLRKGRNHTSETIRDIVREGTTLLSMQTLLTDMTMLKTNHFNLLIHQRHNRETNSEVINLILLSVYFIFAFYLITFLYSKAYMDPTRRSECWTRSWWSC